MNYKLRIIISPSSAGTTYEQTLPEGTYTISPVVNYNYRPIQWLKWTLPTLSFNLTTNLGTSQIVGTSETYTFNLTEDTVLQANCEAFTSSALMSKIL